MASGEVPPGDITEGLGRDPRERDERIAETPIINSKNGLIAFPTQQINVAELVPADIPKIAANYFGWMLRRSDQNVTPWQPILSELEWWVTTKPGEKFTAQELGWRVNKSHASDTERNPRQHSADFSPLVKMGSFGTTYIIPTGII